MPSAAHYQHLANRARRLARQTLDPQLQEYFAHQAKQYDDLTCQWNPPRLSPAVPIAIEPNSNSRVSIVKNSRDA